MQKRKLKICLTGGPSAGKTTVVDFMKREFSDMAMAIPEAASVLYKGGFPRGTKPDEIMSAQRAIYSCQIEMEKMFEAKEGPTLLICDRGTLDQVAYWPHEKENFFTAVGSSLEVEVARYDFVIHLHTSIFDYEQSFPIRTESLQEALELDRKILRAWKPHPRRIEIPSRITFHEKIDTVFQSIEKCLKQAKSSLPRSLQSNRLRSQSHAQV